MKLFVCGNSRSGTTMMSRILGNHPDIFSFQELHYFDELVTGQRQEITPEKAKKLFATLCSIQHHGYFAKRKPEQFLKEAEEAFYAWTGINPVTVYEKFLVKKTEEHGKSVPCEQTPQNIFSADDLLKFYSDAFIIVMVRDPRAVLLSQKKKWMRRKLSGGKIPLRESLRARINYHPVTISKLWNSVMQTVLKIKNDKRVILVRYEDLIAEPKTTIQKLCTGLGISFEEKMLQIPVTGSSNAGDIPNKTGIDSSRLNNWENGALNDTEISICQEINGEMMQHFNYPVKQVTNNPLKKSGYTLILPLQLGLTALVNVKRWKFYWRRLVG